MAYDLSDNQLRHEVLQRLSAVQIYALADIKRGQEQSRAWPGQPEAPTQEEGRQNVVAFRSPARLHAGGQP